MRWAELYSPGSCGYSIALIHYLMPEYALSIKGCLSFLSSALIRQYDQGSITNDLIWLMVLRGLESVVVEQRHGGRQLEQQPRASVLIHNREAECILGLALVYELLRPTPCQTVSPTGTEYSNHHISLPGPHQLVAIS